MARLVHSDDALYVLPIKMRVAPIASVIIASSLVALPLAASAPLWPPLGFMMLISWRLLRNTIWPVWIGLPLGLFDDLMSGQPIGNAIALWTITLMVMESIDRRVIYRDFWMDWALASAALLVYLVAGAMLARAGSFGHIIALVGPQCLWSILLLPLMMRAVAAIDGWRRRL